MDIIIVLVALLLIGAVSYLINRGKRAVNTLAIEDTQSMDAVEVDAIEPYERVLLNAAKSTWCLSSMLMEDGSQQWYVVDKQSGRRLFMVDNNTHAVKAMPQQRKRTTRKTVSV